MKKRIIPLLLILFLLTSTLPAQAAGSTSFFRRYQYGTLTLYENLVYGYSLGIYSKFEMASDEALQEYFWPTFEESEKNGGDAVYDYRYWYSRDGIYSIEIQVKEPTYDSFETEIAMAPKYVELTADEYAPENELKQLHDGILRDTPAGQMLETAVSYISFDSEGNATPIVFVYYDIYARGVEYCFCLHARNGNYEETQSMLDEMMQTVSLDIGLRI